MCPTRLVLVSKFTLYPQYWKRIDAPTHLIRVIVTRPFHNLIYQSVSTLLTYFKTVLFRLALIQQEREIGPCFELGGDNFLDLQTFL